MKPQIAPLLLAVLAAMPTAKAETDVDPLTPWRSGVTVHPVAAHQDRHVIHSYFNTCPESPDGKYVVYFTSTTPEGETGDIRIRERSTGQETILAAGIHTEDAHRAACQQWSNGGRTVVYHDNRDGRWQVMAVDIDSKTPRVLAVDRQVGFGSATGRWAPMYGCHWNPGEHRHLELVNVTTGEIRIAINVQDVVKEYGDWLQKKFKTTDISVFFPVMSPDEKRVFFKLNVPHGGTDFRSMGSSTRDGKAVYDLEQGRFLRLIEKWGHPSWSADGKYIFEHGLYNTDVVTGQIKDFSDTCISDHPSLSPDSRLYVTDADVTKRYWRNPGDWAIAVGSTAKDDWEVLTIFNNSKGATTWRHNHPHPSFSADGRRIYFNVNESQWTTLMVAECASPATARQP